MHYVALISFGLLGGAIVGAVAGFVVAIVVLTLRRLSNRRLVKRGEPPRRHLVLPRFHMPSAFLGGLVGGAAHVWLPLPTALALATASPVAVLLVVYVVALITVRFEKKADA